MDKGPWKAEYWEGKWVVASDDFTHDVHLVIEGDPNPSKEYYAGWLAMELNHLCSEEKDNAALREKVKRLEEAVEWACSYQNSADTGPLYWSLFRDELRRRAGRE